MPQFDFATFLPQMAWLAFFFAILYFGIVRLTVPKVGRVMEAREDKVSSDLSAAEHAKHEADRIAADYAEKLETARGDARAALAESRAAALRSVEEQLGGADAAIHARQEEAQAALDAASARATAEIETIAADAAADIVERLTGARPDQAQAEGAARAALAA